MIKFHIEYFMNFRDSMSVLIEDRLFYLDTEKILQIFRDLCFIEGTTIKARISGQEIVSM